eukprot:jgi/Mesen1/3406/ME000192S02569
MQQVGGLSLLRKISEKVIQHGRRPLDGYLNTPSALPGLYGQASRQFDRRVTSPALPYKRSLERWPGRGIHIFQAVDQLGIVAQISETVSSRRANILSVDLHIDMEASPDPIFYSRSEFAFDPASWPRPAMEADFAALAARLQAHRSVVKVVGSDPPPKMAILASWQDHCLVDLLYRWQEGELAVDITCVISNHARKENTHVMRFLQRHGIPYHHVATSKSDKKEAQLLEIVGGDATDFLVLSPSFLQGYGKDIINIHHGLLPSFKGANPYRQVVLVGVEHNQAYKAGVKLIGATSHFVTDELDTGPIIEQLVDRVSHRDSLLTFAGKSETLEKQCLATAVKYYCEARILRFGVNKTMVFS